MENTLAGVERLSNALVSMNETLALIVRKFKAAEWAGRAEIRAIPIDGVVEPDDEGGNDQYSTTSWSAIGNDSRFMTHVNAEDVKDNTTHLETASGDENSSMLGGLSVKRRSSNHLNSSLKDTREQSQQQQEETDPAYEEFMEAQPGDTVTLPNGLTLVIPNDAAFHENKAMFYMMLTQTWAYDGSLTQYLESDERVQAITDGRAGAENVNMDYYSVTLRVPEDATAQAIYEDMVNSPDTMGGQDATSTASFNRRPGDDGVTQQGDIFDLDMPALGLEYIGRSLGIQNGAVIAAITGEDYAVMQTIYTPSYGEGTSNQNHGYHPVNGARSFGYVDNGDGTYTYYTLGTDTPNYDVAGAVTIFARSQQDENWRNWQDAMEDYARTEDYEITERQEWRNYSEGQGIASLNQTTDPEN